LAEEPLRNNEMGYGERSLNELSRKLTPADVPVLVSLLPDRELSVGVQFALASQCEHAISAVRGAATTHKMGFLDASDVMSLISSFQGCTAQARSQAKEALAELDALRRDEQAVAKRRAEERATEAPRIQQNGVRMMRGSKQTQELNRDEREEVFRRSLKAMGLSEDDP
jgi:transposase